MRRHSLLREALDDIVFYFFFKRNQYVQFKTILNFDKKIRFSY